MNAPITRRATLGLLGTAVSGLAGAASTEQDLSWIDSARGRELPLRLRWPASAGPWPVVLFSHGLGGSREGADVWGRSWCDAGFVVLHLQHPGSDTEVLRKGGISGLRAAATAQQLLARTADVRFVLDEAARLQRAAQGPWRDLRMDAIGLAGHSFGAATTMAIAGQRYPAPGSLADPRPQAFIALSPTSARGRLSVEQQFGAITRPLLAVTGSLDGDPFGSHDTGEPRAKVYDGLPPGQRALLWLEGADHMSFGGNRLQRIDGRGPFKRAAVARQREDAHHALVARLSTLWWRWRLRGDADAMAELQSASRQSLLSEGDRLTLG